MKSFTLISGILIILLGVFFFANPTSLLAIVGWIFALMMLISGGSSLMVYFKRDNENRSFFQLLQSVISIVFGIILLSASVWVLSGVAVTIIAWWLLGLSLYPRLPSLSPTSVWFFRATCFVNRLDLFSIWSLALLCTIFLSLSYWSLCSLLNYLCRCICPLLFIPLMVEQSYFTT